MICDKTLVRDKKAKNANNKFSAHDSFLDNQHRLRSPMAEGGVYVLGWLISIIIIYIINHVSADYWVDDTPLE